MAKAKAGRPKRPESMRPDFAAYYAATGRTANELSARTSIARTTLFRYQREGIPERARLARQAWRSEIQRAASELRAQGRESEAQRLDALL